MVPSADISSSGAAVIGAAVGGLAGVLGASVTAWFNRSALREERVSQSKEREDTRQGARDDRLRERMLEVSTSFVQEIEWIRSRTSPIAVGDVETILPVLDQRLALGLSQLGSISLLFGAESNAAREARGAHYHAITVIANVRLLSEIDLADREGSEIGKRIGGTTDELSASLTRFTEAAAAGLQHGPPWISQASS